MLLSPSDVALFFKLYRGLLFFVNQRLRVVDVPAANPDEFSHVVAEQRLNVRDAFLGRLDLLSSFVDENPSSFTNDELDIVRSWQHLIHGNFYNLRQLQKHALFLSSGKESVVYGVVALSQPFAELTGPRFPVMVRAVLLPFKDKIIYDSLLLTRGISFGPGIRRLLNESLKGAKARHGVVTSLPLSDQPVPARRPKTKPPPRPPWREETAAALAEIIAMIDAFCGAHLNEEYAALCRQLAEKLGRKRPSPLLSGSPNAWASGIVRTIGWVNFLDDKSQTPHMALRDIDAHFGIGSSTGAAKLGAIRKLLRIHRLDPNWTLPSRLADNPMAWMITVNGLIVDARQAPRELQELAYRKGLIPYIPADRTGAT